MANKKKLRSDRHQIRSERPLISVCMIVKDEESNLERCLRSVKQAADEIIVVDTGSQDRTVDIARRYGAKVSYFQWCDDFAAARNAALEQAGGQWVLQMDADEALTPDSARRIRQVVNNAPSQCWGFLIQCRSYKIEDGRQIHTFIHRLLLFRNHPDLRYRNRIHENLEYIGTEAKPEFWANDDLVVEHFGYLPEPMIAKNKDARNQHLLQVAIEENPDDPFHHFNLGTHYFSRQMYDEAIALLKRATELCSDSTAGYLPNAYAMLVLALCEVGRGDEVPVAIAEAEKRVKTLTADFHCNAGTALRMIGQLEQALGHFQRAIESNEVKIGSEFDANSRTWLPRFGIGTIYEMWGRWDLARTYYEDALSFVPQHSELNCRLSSVLMELGNPQSALQAIKRALEDGALSNLVCWDLLNICAAIADRKEAGEAGLVDVEALADELLQRIDVTPELGAKLCGLCVRFGQFERGIAVATAVLESGEDLMVRVNRGLCYFNLGRYQDAVEDLAVAADVGGDDPDARATLDTIQRSIGNAIGPLVSIIIPVFDGVDHTKRCVAAIAENTPEDLYEVIIVDNASTDGTKDFLSLLGGDVKIISNSTNLGYHRACNQGASEAAGKYLVFLCNQSEPQRGWLERLVALAGDDSSVGAVGAKLIDPGGALCEAGATVYSNGSLRQCGRGKDPKEPEFNFIREVDYCSTTSLLVRKDLWNEIKGFDAAYSTDQYRSADLCFSIRSRGGRVLYQPEAEVVFHGVGA